MNLLRVTLRWQALVWAVTGAGVLVAPGWVVEGLLDQPPIGEDAWLRAAGATAIAMAAQMVLVSRRVEDLWWWAWSFALLEVALTVVFATEALVGTEAASWPLWTMAAVSAGFAALDLAAIARTGTERVPL